MLTPPCTRFGSEIMRAPQRHTNKGHTVGFAHVGNNPLATFVFKYRPLGVSDKSRLFFLTDELNHVWPDVLKANGIVPIVTSKKRRAIAEPEVENVKQEVTGDRTNESGRITALEVHSLTLFPLNQDFADVSTTGRRKYKHSCALFKSFTKTGLIRVAQNTKRSKRSLSIWTMK
jgi:hypothetical protein